MNKFLSLYLFFLSLFYLLFLNNLIMIWVLMELNMFCFIMFLINFGVLNLEVIMFIFVIQILSSFLMIMFIFFNFDSKDIFFIYGLVIKMSFFPTYYWYYLVFFLSDMGIFLMLGYQKLFVYGLMSNFMVEKNLMVFLFMSLVVVILNLKQNYIKIIVIFSSLFHSCWIFLSFLNGSFSFFLYFFIYVLTLMFVVYNLLIKNNTIIFFLSSVNMIFLLLTISSLPPFLLFIPKFYLIYLLQLYSIMLILLLFFTLLNMTIYLRIMFLMILIAVKIFKNFFYNQNLFILFFLNFFFLLLV